MKYSKLLQILLIVLISFAGLISYYIFRCNTKIEFNIDWNMFDSDLMVPLFIVSFILGLGQKIITYEPWTVEKDKYGNEIGRKKDEDLVRNIEAGWIWPLVQYLVLGPLLIAAMIYYALMGIVYLFGVIFPIFIIVFFFLTLILLFRWGYILLEKKKGEIYLLLIALSVLGIFFICYIFWVPPYDSSIGLMKVITIGLVFCITVAFIGVIFWNTKKKKIRNNDIPRDSSSLLSVQFVLGYIVYSIILFGFYGYKRNSSYLKNNMTNRISVTNMMNDKGASSIEKIKILYEIAWCDSESERIDKIPAINK